eukprot:gi/632987603/ref/XP_007882646.1/ PREDICTED: immunoglobulin superfamily member 1-like isoform X2 [Callorhinchus milii]
MFVSQSECLCNSFCYNIIPDPLEKPNISMMPDFRVFVRGESGEISCSGNYPGSNFSLYRDGNIIASRTAPENNNKATFTSLKITAGNYWCTYTKHMDGRELTSPESERLRISMWDPLEKPNISMKPDFRVFVRGESAEISCSGNYPGSNFSLYRDGNIIASRIAPENNNKTTFTSLKSTAGNYWCKYTKHMDGRELTSPESERVGVTLWDPLQKPNISLQPDSRLFMRWESAQISCSGNDPGSNFFLYRDGKVIASRIAPENKNSATFTASEISAGYCWCKYTKRIDGRELTSPESERLRIFMWDPHQKPIISMKPASRVFVRGESAEISCAGNYPGSNFSLYRDGNIIASRTAPENSNTATFTTSEIRAGNYWCKYTTQMNGRELTSPESERVGVTLRDPIQKPTISLQTDSRVFLRSESAQITCSGNYPGSNFSLYRDGRFIASLTVQENNNNATFIPLETRAGNYSCKYTKRMDGRELTSPESELVRISLWNPLQKPTISFKPDFRVFVRGESAEISCAGNYPGSKFSLYSDGEFITSQSAPENSNTAIFTPSEFREGTYWCRYAENMDGRVLTSPESERVGVTLWDSLQKPTISMTPNFLVRGKIAHISCSGNYPGSNFSLYRDGEFITSQPSPGNNNTATFTPLAIGAGNYTCKYTTLVDGRELTSSESERVGISVRANWTVMHTVGLSVGIVTAIVITVLILGFSVYKRGCPSWDSLPIGGF